MSYDEVSTRLRGAGERGDGHANEFELRVTAGADYVERVLGDHGGNVARAASASGLALRYFQVLRARQAKEAPDNRG